MEQNTRRALLIAHRGFDLETGRVMLAKEEMKAHYLGAHAHVKEARQRRRGERANV